MANVIESSKDFAKEFKELVVGMESLSSRIEKRINDLKQIEKHQEEISKLMDANVVKAKQKIKLDIGGKLFTTSKTTLLSIEGTYFHAMLSSGSWQPDEDGNL
jgi:hypothetical protein